MHDRGFSEILEEIANENSDLHSGADVDSPLRVKILSGWESSLDPRYMSYLLGQQAVLQIKSRIFQSAHVKPQTHPYIKYRNIPHPHVDIKSDSVTESVMPPPAAAAARKPHRLNTVERKAYETIIDSAHASNLLPPGFTASELKKTFLAAAKRTHPDRGGTHERFLETKACYEILVAFLKGLE